MDAMALVLTVWIVGVVVSTWFIAKQHRETAKLVKGFTEMVVKAVDGKVEEKVEPWYTPAVRIATYAVVSTLWPILVTVIGTMMVGTFLAILAKSDD